MSLLERFGLTEVKTVSTRSDLNLQLVKDDGVSKDVDPVKVPICGGQLTLRCHGYPTRHWTSSRSSIEVQRKTHRGSHARS